MVLTCSAVGCTNRGRKGGHVKFHRFPADVNKRNRWIVAMKRLKLDDTSKLWEPKDHDRLCSDHFIGGVSSDDPDHPGYVPSLFSFTPLTSKTPRSSDRYKRRAQRRLALSPLQENDQENDQDAAAIALLELGSDLPQRVNKGTDPDPDPLLFELDALQTSYGKLQAEYQRVLEENRTMKEQMEIEKFTYKNLTNNQMRSVTGLPSCAVFLFIFSLVSMCIKQVGKMCPADQLLMVLMKLRLNLTNADLALRFKICPTQVSRIFSKLVPILAKKLRFLIRWPSKGTILKNIPMSFRSRFKKCRVIIDCSEVFIQRPSNLDTRAKTYSNYKHHNTLKFLVGITPYGAISFLSKCWGGRVSDKEITARSGFYDKLDHGDLVLADRGFLISEELAVYGASLAIPPFTRGKKQHSHRERLKRHGDYRVHVFT